MSINVIFTVFFLHVLDDFFRCCLVIGQRKQRLQTKEASSTQIVH